MRIMSFTNKKNIHNCFMNNVRLFLFLSNYCCECAHKMKRCKDDEEEDEWEPLRRRPALGRPGTSSERTSENQDGSELNGGVVPVACASQTHLKTDLPSSVAAIALTTITASGSSTPKTSTELVTPEVNSNILNQSVTSSSQRKLSVSCNSSVSASASSASSGLISASFDISFPSSASLPTQTTTATIKSLPPYAVSSWTPEKEEYLGKTLSKVSTHSVASPSKVKSSNAASDTSSKASDTQCTLTCKDTPTTKTVEGVTTMQGSSKSVLAVDIVSVQNVNKKLPKPLVNGSITDSTIATTTDSVIFSSGSLPSRANGSLVVTSSLLGNSITKDTVSASVSVEADSQLIVSVSSSKATRSAVASISKDTPTTLTLADTAMVPTTAITIATSPTAEVIQAKASIPNAFIVSTAASLATSTVPVSTTTTAVTLPMVTATATIANKLIVATAVGAATNSAKSSISTVEIELPSTEGETSATSVPITSTSANVLGTTLSDTGTSEQVCIQHLPRSSLISGSHESPASSASDSSVSDIIPRASTSLPAYSSSDSSASSTNDTLPPSVSAALNPLQLLILSSDSSSESSNDSVGVVPSTYSVGGEAQAQNSVESLCLALHSINSLPAPTTTTSEVPPYETAYNSLSSESLATESLGQDGTNVQENVSSVQLPSSMSSLLAASSSQSSSSLSSSSPSPENVSLTSTSNSENSPHGTGSSTSATNQTYRKSTKGRNNWGKKAPENLTSEDLDDKVMTAASLDVISDTNHRLMTRDAERKYKEKHIYLSGRGKLVY